MFARAYEQWASAPICLAPPSSEASGCSSVRQGPAGSMVLATSVRVSSAMVCSGRSVPTKKFSMAEIVDCLVKGLYFHYDEKFIPGHKEECRGLVSDDKVDGDPTDPTISLHALTGIQQHTSKTMQLWVQIDDATIMALLDSGSTHNFLDTAIAEHIGLAPQAATSFCVTVASGDRLDCSRRYTNLDIDIADELHHVLWLGTRLLRDGPWCPVAGGPWSGVVGPPSLHTCIHVHRSIHHHRRWLH
jgi:hypothetical protein